MNMTIGFIGTGNMGKAMMKGMLASKKVGANQIYAYDVYQPGLEATVKELGIQKVANEAEVAKNAKMIIIAVKPDTVTTVLEKIKNDISKETIIISIAAGVTLKKLHAAVDKDTKVIRCMPNTPALVLESMSMLCEDGGISDEDKKLVLEIFSTFGKAEFMPEKYMDAVVGVSGSSPAYVYMFIEALADGAVQGGMPRDKAYTFAAQAVMGAAKMVLETGKHPGELKDMVCSPGGTTIDAVATLEKTGFRASVIETVAACIAKNKEMSKGE